MVQLDFIRFKLNLGLLCFGVFFRFFSCGSTTTIALAIYIVTDESHFTISFHKSFENPACVKRGTQRTQKAPLATALEILAYIHNRSRLRSRLRLQIVFDTAAQTRREFAT